jgi:ParB-like nuclease domain
MSQPTLRAGLPGSPDGPGPAALGLLPVTTVPVAALVDADSPRLSGEDTAHTRSLVAAAEPLPPLVVQRQTMRVIDGMHRLRAARLRGDTEIDVRLFDGDEASSFVVAVRTNITHGLPLTLADRKEAAARIIGYYPYWSDRMIAEVAGLAASSVAVMRPTARNQQLDRRLGRDGRLRPVNSAERREIAGRLMADDPTASLRQIARQAGISPETARDVRARLRSGGNPSIVGRRDRHRHDGAGLALAGTALSARARERGPVGGRAGASSLALLMADPAFRCTDCGRALLRMLSAHKIIREHSERLTASIPDHCKRWVADAARACATEWQEFAERLDEQTVPVR